MDTTPTNSPTNVKGNKSLVCKVRVTEYFTGPDADNKAAEAYHNALLHMGYLGGDCINHQRLWLELVDVEASRGTVMGKLMDTYLAIGITYTFVEHETAHGQPEADWRKVLGMADDEEVGVEGPLSTFAFVPPPQPHQPHQPHQPQRPDGADKCATN